MKQGAGAAVRCAECGQKTAKASPYCVLCGARIAQRWSLAAEPSTGGAGGAIVTGQAAPPAREALPEVNGAILAEWAEWARAQRFSVTRLRPGYDEEEVDAFLEEAERRLGYLAAEDTDDVD